MRNTFLSYVACGILVATLPAGAFAQASAQADKSRHPAVPSANEAGDAPGSPAPSLMGEIASAGLPDSPGVVEARLQGASQQEGSSAQPQAVSTSQSPVAPSPQTSQDSKAQRPVGTAAAKAPTVSGITAAEPAGVAIAPAKQHRVRTILIRVGAIVGAGVALGTTIALTEATPSKPPGAR